MANALGNPAWKDGVSGNPSGRSPQAITWQKYSERAALLIDKFEIDEILAMGDDPKLLAKRCSTLDGMIVVNLASALRKDGKERERLLDRLLGKAVQRIGGENPGEGIKIAGGNAMALESMTDDELHGLLDALEAIAATRATPIAEPSNQLTTDHLLQTIAASDGDGESEDDDKDN